MTLTAVSADSHVTEPGDCYLPFIDPAYRDRAPVSLTHDMMGAVMSVDNGRSRDPVRHGRGGRSLVGPDRPPHLRRLGRAAPGRLGSEGPPRRAGSRWRQGRSALPVGRHDPVQPPRRRLQEGLFRRVQRVARALRLSGSRPADRSRADRAAQRRGRHRGSGTDRRRSGCAASCFPGFAGCFDGSSREGDYDDPRWDPLWQAADRPEAAAVVPHPHRQRQPRRGRSSAARR